VSILCLVYNQTILTFLGNIFTFICLQKIIKDTQQLSFTIIFEVFKLNAYTPVHKI